jgi:hypothetical protein
MNLFDAMKKTGMAAPGGYYRYVKEDSFSGCLRWYNKETNKSGCIVRWYWIKLVSWYSFDKENN